jgi:hypothetical protein
MGGDVKAHVALARAIGEMKARGAALHVAMSSWRLTAM